MRASHLRRTGATALAAATALGLTACSSPVPAGPAAPAASAAPTAGARIAVTVPGGVVVLDGADLSVVDEFATEEFTRLNAAGDGRHLLLTTTEGFQVLDTAAGSTDPAALTGLTFSAEAPGHVVRHAGRTVLFDDGTGDTTVFDPAALNADALPETEVVPGAQPHHGVSVVLQDGTLLTTVGTADSRSGVRVVAPSGEEVASSDECPGVHGEGTAAGEAVVFGCEDGALLYRDGGLVKLDAPDAEYARMGNAWVSETSPLVVGDHRDDPDGEGYLLSSLTVIDTEAETLDVVPLPAGVQYTFRDVARGPEDLAYVLGTDGAIHVFDPTAREVTGSFPVIDAWEGPVEWQDAHPSIQVSGGTAYVTEPAANAVHAVDLATGEVTATVELDAAPNELAIAA